MKNLTRYFALIMVGFSTNMFAQASATANVAVNIETPIGITKSDDMVFGNVATNGSTGAVYVSPEGTRTPIGGVTLPVSNGSPKAASFIVTGAGNYTYSISLPSSPITLSGNSDGVTVSSFVSNPKMAGRMDITGSQIVSIGATLNLPASVAAGSYTNASGLNITVNYN